MRRNKKSTSKFGPDLFSQALKEEVRFTSKPSGDFINNSFDDKGGRIINLNHYKMKEVFDYVIKNTKSF